MFQSDAKASFSELWYRVAPTRPKLSPHAHVVRQQFGPEIAYVVEEPASGRYYRMTEAALFFVGLLDGRRTVDEAWHACVEQLGDASPTQRECLDILAKLQSFGLLLGTESLAPELIGERLARARRERRQQRAGKWVFLSIPLINPEPWLERYKHLIGPLYSRPMAAVWIAVLAAGVYAVASNARSLGGELNGLLDPASLGAMAVLFLVIRAVHELGHATACKAMGGRSTEIGVILIGLILPLPYCDATSAWKFTETWRRVVVSAGGMLVEVFLAAIAAIVWASTMGSEGSVVHSLAYQTMIVSGVTTVLFNMNPLLRYDGYYILSDLLGIPNMALRARAVWRYLTERYAFGIRGISPPGIRDRAELWVLLVYGVLAPPYRLLIGIGIVLILASRYLTLGLVLGAAVAVVMFVVPAFKGLGYLLGSPRLVGRRGRAIGLVGSIAATLTIGVGVVPLPSGSHAPGVLEPVRKGVVRAGEEGFISQVHAQRGQEVVRGQVLFELDNPALVAELRAARARLDRAVIERDRAAEGSPAGLRVAERRVENARASVERAERRVALLSVRAPVTGRLVVGAAAGTDLRNLLGRYVERGRLLAMVASTDELVVDTSVSDRERAFIFREGDDRIDEVEASFRVRGRAWREIEAVATSMAPIATRELRERALGTGAGGEILMDPTDPERRRTLRPHAAVKVVPLGSTQGLQPGQRVRVRFETPRASLASQVLRRVRQHLGGRFSL